MAFAVEIRKSEHNHCTLHIQMEENNYIFLAGDDALVYMPNQCKKTFHKICLGPLISSHKLLKQNVSSWYCRGSRPAFVLQHKLKKTEVISI